MSTTTPADAEATTTLADATPQQQRRIYQLLQLRMHVAPDRILDIHGSIPTHGTLGEVSAEALRRRALRSPTRYKKPIGLCMCRTRSQ